MKLVEKFLRLPYAGGALFVGAMYILVSGRPETAQAEWRKAICAYVRTGALDFSWAEKY